MLKGTEDILTAKGAHWEWPVFGFLAPVTYSGLYLPSYCNSKPGQSSQAPAIPSTLATQKTSEAISLTIVLGLFM